MRFSSVLACVVCAIVLVGTACGKSWNRWHGSQNGEPRYGEYTRTVGGRSKFQRQIQNQIQRTSWWWRPRRPSCEDSSPRHCQYYKRMLDAFGETCKNTTRLRPRRRLKLMWKCKMTCGLCDTEEPYNRQRASEVDSTRRKQPFPQLVGSVGGRDTPRSGVYYIFTRQISLK